MQECRLHLYLILKLEWREVNYMLSSVVVECELVNYLRHHHTKLSFVNGSMAQWLTRKNPREMYRALMVLQGWAPITVPGLPSPISRNGNWDPAF